MCLNSFKHLGGNVFALLVIVENGEFLCSTFYEHFMCIYAIMLYIFTYAVFIELFISAALTILCYREFSYDVY